MLKESRFHEADPSLLPFLRAADGMEQERLLGTLISDQAGPLIREIIRGRLRFRAAGYATSDVPDGEDVYGEIILRLLKRLREAKADPRGEVIRSFRSYVAVTALNACHDYLRKKYPQRCSLENKLRYLLIRDPQFSLWQSDTQGWRCGFAAWANQDVDCPSLMSQLRENPRAFLPAIISNTDTRFVNPHDLLSAVFDLAGHPVELGDLVTLMANLWGIKDAPDRSYDGDDQFFDSLPDPRPRSDKVLELRMSLEQLWKEICLLPPKQRAALLLNLRDEQNRDIIALIPDTRTANFQEIAKTLEIPLEQFAQLWQKLPMDDATIGELLGATPRQVIRLRKCARDRLSRRMKHLSESDIVSLHKSKRA